MAEPINQSQGFPATMRSRGFAYPHSQTAMSAASFRIPDSAGENFHFLLPWELFVKSSCSQFGFNSRAGLVLRDSEQPLDPWDGQGPY